MNFKFEPFHINKSKRTKQILWESIRKIDLDNIIYENDIDTLEALLPQLQLGKLRESEYNQQDPRNILNFVQLIRMALQYFDYSLSYQNQLLDALYQEEKTTQSNINIVEKSIKTNRKEINFLKDKSKVEQTALIQFKEKLDNKVAFCCYFCENKQFETDNALDEHYKRRHFDEMPKTADIQQQTLLTVQTILLQQQINQIVMAQQSQSLQLNQFQQAIYFQTLKITDDNTDSESDEEPYMDEEQLIIQASIDQMKLDMAEREEFFKQKIIKLEEAIQDKLLDLSQSQILEKKQQEDLEVIRRIDQLQKQIVDIQNQKQQIMMPFNQEQLSIKTEKDIIRNIIINPITEKQNVEPQLNNPQPIENQVKKLDWQEEVEISGEQVEEEIEEPQHQSEIIEETHQEDQQHKTVHDEAEFYTQEKDFISMIKQIKRRKQRNKKIEITEGEKQNFIDFRLEGNIADHFYKLFRTDISTLYKKQPEDIEQYVNKLGCQHYLNIEISLGKKLPQEQIEQHKKIDQSKIPPTNDIPQQENSKQNIKQPFEQIQQQEELFSTPQETIFSKKKQSLQDSYDDFSKSEENPSPQIKIPTQTQKQEQLQQKKPHVHSAIQKKQFKKKKLPGEEDSFDESAESNNQAGRSNQRQKVQFDDDEFD